VEFRTLKIEDWVEHHVEVYTFGGGSPEVVITGGIHGGEATGTRSAHRLIQFLRGRELKGTVKVIPVANPTAFRRLERTSPFDQLDLNRIFPGKEEGTVSQRLANTLWEEIQDCDYLVDLHCCGVYGSSYTLAVYNEFDFVRDLAGMLATPRVVQSGGVRGQLFTELCHKGTPAVIIELPGGGSGGVVNTAAVDETFGALTNMLRGLGVVDGDYIKPEPRFYQQLQRVTTPVNGYYEPQVAAGERIVKDQVVATVEALDEKGEAKGIVEIKAPYTGAAIIVRPASYVFSGEPALVVAADE